jgi:hypothetical protein
MSSGIDFVLYLGPAGNGPSDQCRRLHSQMSDQARARIKIMDYGEITRALGPKKPAWLRGFPTLVSYESPPRVLEGTPVITTMTDWVQDRTQQAPPQAQAQQRMQGQQQPQRTQQIPSTPVIGTVDQGEGGFSRGSVVTDDLYVSRMDSKHGGGDNSRGRVSSSEIEAYNRARASGGRQ